MKLFVTARQLTCCSTVKPKGKNRTAMGVDVAGGVEENVRPG